MHTAAASLLLLAASSLGATLPSAARDANPGCFDTFFHGFSWTVTGFNFSGSYIYSTPAHEDTEGLVSFGLANPALAYAGACTAHSTQPNDFFYGTVAYSCTFPQPGGAHTTAEFQFDRPSGLLNITQSWACSDKDPQNPYV